MVCQVPAPGVFDGSGAHPIQRAWCRSTYIAAWRHSASECLCRCSQSRLYESSRLRIPGRSIRGLFSGEIPSLELRICLGGIHQLPDPYFPGRASRAAACGQTPEMLLGPRGDLSGVWKGRSVCERRFGNDSRVTLQDAAVRAFASSRKWRRKHTDVYRC